MAEPEKAKRHPTDLTDGEREIVRPSLPKDFPPRQTVFGGSGASYDARCSARFKMWRWRSTENWKPASRAHLLRPVAHLDDLAELCAGLHRDRN
jgi:hypothetical protein